MEVVFRRIIRMKIIKLYEIEMKKLSIKGHL